MTDIFGKRFEHSITQLGCRLGIFIFAHFYAINMDFYKCSKVYILRHFACNIKNDLVFKFECS